MRSDLKYRIRRSIDDISPRSAVFFAVNPDDIRPRIRAVADRPAPRFSLERPDHFRRKAVRKHGKSAVQPNAGELPMPRRRILPLARFRHAPVSGKRIDGRSRAHAVNLKQPHLFEIGHVQKAGLRACQKRVAPFVPVSRGIRQSAHAEAVQYNQKYPLHAISNATSIISVKERSRSSAVHFFPVKISSLTVQSASAFFPARAALI